MFCSFFVCLGVFVGFLGVLLLLCVCVCVCVCVCYLLFRGLCFCC